MGGGILDTEVNAMSHPPIASTTWWGRFGFRVPRRTEDSDAVP